MATKLPPRPDRTTDWRNRAREMAPRRTRDLGTVEVLRRHPDFDPEHIRTDPSGILTYDEQGRPASWTRPAGLTDEDMRAASEAKRAQRAARFDETVAQVHPYQVQETPLREESIPRADRRAPQSLYTERVDEGAVERRRDPRGGRRVLDLSEETVDRLATQPRMSELAEQASNSTIGSSRQFDWFDRAEPFERYEITRAAAERAGVGREYTAFADAERAGVAPTPQQIEAHARMRAVRDTMLAADPRSVVEAPAVRSNTLSSIAESRAMGAVRGAGKWLNRLAWPLAATGAILGVADEAEGSSLLNKANAAVRGGFGFDVINANRVLGKRLGLIRNDDNTI